MRMPGTGAGRGSQTTAAPASTSRANVPSRSSTSSAMCPQPRTSRAAGGLERSRATGSEPARSSSSTRSAPGAAIIAPRRPASGTSKRSSTASPSAAPYHATIASRSATDTPA